MTSKIKRVPIILPETGNWKFPKRLLKTCPRCGKYFVPKSARTIFCEECQYPHELEMARERARKYRETGRRAELDQLRYQVIDGKRVYVSPGRNQSGENNGNYKNGSGIDWYKKAIEVLPEKCNRCGATESELQERLGTRMRNLLLHHKDGNHNNNSPDNWEILCKRCHQLHHSERDSKTGRFVSQKG